MSDKDDPSAPHFFSKQKSEIDDILSDIDHDLSNDDLDMDIEPPPPLSASKPFRSSLNKGFAGGLKMGSSLGGVSSGGSRKSLLLLGGLVSLLALGGTGAYLFLGDGLLGGGSEIRKPLAPLAPLDPALSPNANGQPSLTPPDAVGAADAVVPPVDPNNPNAPVLNAGVPPVPTSDGAIPPVPQAAPQISTGTAALDPHAVPLTPAAAVAPVGVDVAAPTPVATAPAQTTSTPPATGTVALDAKVTPDAKSPEVSKVDGAKDVTNAAPPLPTDKLNPAPADKSSGTSASSDTSKAGTGASVVAPDVASTDAGKTPSDKVAATDSTAATLAGKTADASSVDKTVSAKSESKTVTKSSQKTAPIKYFDSPSGKILDDIQPPSIDVSRDPGESIIIVQKPLGADRYESDIINSGDGSVSIQRSAASNELSQKAVAADRALRLGRYDAALDFYQDILAQNSNDVTALLGRAIALQKLNRLDEAAAGYRAVLRRDPSNISAATNLAGIQTKQSPEAALKNLERVYADTPDDPSVKGQIGVTLAETGNLESAYQAFVKATQSDPHNPQHFFNLAVTAERLGKKNEAISAYEKCLEVDAIYGTGRGINRDVIYDRLAKLRGQ